LAFVTEQQKREVERQIILEEGNKEMARIKAEGQKNATIIQAEAKKEAAETIKKAQEEGYDGVVIKSVKDNYNNNKMTKPTDTYVVFSSNQIKSATGNSGAFSKNTNDIRGSVDLTMPLGTAGVAGGTLAAMGGVKAYKDKKNKSKSLAELGKGGSK
jgi:hypothetical protein